MAEQPFCVEDGGELRADAFDVEKHGRRRVGSLLGEERSACVLDDFDLCDDQLGLFHIVRWQLRDHARGKPALVVPAARLTSR
jgi:hypothetical protein